MPNDQLLPKERGHYEVTASYGRRTFTFWAEYSHITAHWFIDGKECGFMNKILLPGVDHELTIQDVKQ